MRAVRWPLPILLLPSDEGDQLGWRMVEVKSSTSVRITTDDAAIRLRGARSRARTTAIAVARIDSGWTYPGQGRLPGLAA